MTTNPEQMGKNILYYLKIKGLTQVDLAKRLNTSKQVINKIVKGKRGLSPTEFVGVSEFLDISMEALLTEAHDFQLSDVKSVLLCGDKMSVEDANFISALIENLSEMREDVEIYGLEEI